MSAAASTIPGDALPGAAGAGVGPASAPSAVTGAGSGAGAGAAGAVRSVSTSAARASGAGGEEGAKRVNYEEYLTDNAKRRQPSAIRALMPLMKQPGMISLHGGMPNPGLFPFMSMTVTLRDGSVLALDEEQFGKALQYSETPGLPPLVERFSNLQLSEHDPPAGARDFSMVITTGSQDALAKAIDVLVTAGTPVLVESPTYTGALAALRGQGAKLVGVRVDEDGLDSADLARVLESWDEAEQGPRPRLLYTIPTGSNPAGCTMSVQRRRETYQLCRKYDIIILEDDPYYFLQFAADRVPSLFSMDVDGRVLRFDSMSKILCPGLRIGFVTGPPGLVSRINLNAQSTCLHTSGLSQAMVLAFFQHYRMFESVTPRSEGLGTFEEHLAGIRRFYRAQRDEAVKLAHKHLDGLATFNVPAAGMFLWLKLVAVEDSFALIRDKAAAANVLLVPGNPFMPDDSVSQYARASFSIATPEKMDEAFARLATLLRAEVEAQAAAADGSATAAPKR